MSDIILWEHQKKRVCEFYECSDGKDRQYPECRGVRPKKCRLHDEILPLIHYLNTGKLE